MWAMAKEKKKSPWAAKLKALRKAKGLTHAEMAEELAISIRTLRAYLYGQRTPSNPVQRLIKQLEEKTI
jgi:transcriptional regulator with XRE-family HTH domain